MKTLHEKFTEEEYANLKESKDGKSWHDFILEKCLPKSKDKPKDPFDSDVELGELW